MEVPGEVLVQRTVDAQTSSWRPGWNPKLGRVSAIASRQEEPGWSLGEPLVTELESGTQGSTLARTGVLRWTGVGSDPNVGRGGPEEE